MTAFFSGMPAESGASFSAPVLYGREGKGNPVKMLKWISKIAILRFNDVNERCKAL
jgi:hypothetical protein